MEADAEQTGGATADLTDLTGLPGSPGGEEWYAALPGAAHVRVELGDLLERVPDPGRLLTHLRDRGMVAPAGQLVLAIHDVTDPGGVAAVLEGRPPRPELAGPRAWFTAESMTGVLQAHGFAVERVVSGTDQDGAPIQHMHARLAGEAGRMIALAREVQQLTEERAGLARELEVARALLREQQEHGQDLLRRTAAELEELEQRLESRREQVSRLRTRRERLVAQRDTAQRQLELARARDEAARHELESYTRSRAVRLAHRLVTAVRGARDRGGRG